MLALADNELNDARKLIGLYFIERLKGQHNLHKHNKKNVKNIEIPCLKIKIVKQLNVPCLGSHTSKKLF
jgi:hypothetical protein